MKKENLYLGVSICFISILLLLLFGAYFVEFALGHAPCRLCYLQRMGLLLSSICLVISLRRHCFRSFGLCVMCLLFGAIVSVRHNCLKLCSDGEIRPVIFGRGLPFWSFWIFVASLFGVGVLLFLIEEKKMITKRHKLNCFLVVIICAAFIGTLSAYLQKGFSF